MRAGIVAIFFFAGLLALGHYVAAPFFCRGEIALASLDPRALCGADFHLNRSGSVLLYFGSIAAALFFGVIAGMLPGGSKTAAKEKPEAKPAETFEQIVASEEKKQTDATPPVAHPSALVAPAAAATADASATASPTPATATPPATASTPAAPVEEVGPSRSTAEAAQAAIESAINSPSAPQKTDDAATPAVPAPPPVPSPETAAMTEAITVGLSVTKSAARGPFDGTNEELLERFRELKKQEGVNSIAQAQRLLDESTLSALSKGVDPKQHLSQVAHLVLAEDPDLKSGVVRGVVVHIAARLKELGVVQKFPNPAKGAA